MNIRTFKCQRGESYNEQNGTCNLCSSSQSLYSVVIKASKCSVQDDITMKSVNSTHIELRQYFWRPYDDNNIVEYCYSIGGRSTGDESCVLGHIGALCEQCDIYNIRGLGQYAGSALFQCGSCSNLQLNTIQIFLIIIWTLISIFLSVKGTVENVDELIMRMKGIKAGFVCVYFERVQIQVLMKILTNYLQIISTIGTFQLKLPPQLRSMFTYSGNPIKSMMFSLDCFLVDLSNISIIYFRNVWFILMPFYYSTVIFLIYLLLIKLKYLQFKITVISTTLIFIFIYVQPDIIGSFISLLSYRKISQVYWVQGNVSYLYFTPIHIKWLLSFVLPVFIIFGSLIPIILYILMARQKHKLNDTYVYRLYGYLYNEYSKTAYYWEIVKICQKEFIIIFLTFYEDIIIIKGTLVFIIIFCYDISSKRYKPYKRIDLNHLDSQSSFVCGFSIVLGMGIYFADQNGNTEILWPFYLIMGIFNLYFIIRLISLLIIGYVDKMADQLDKIRDYINQKYPNIVVKYPQLQRYLENSKIKSKRVNQRFMKLKEFLMIKVRQNCNLRQNQKLPTDCDQEIQQKELKYDSKNQEQINQQKSIQSDSKNKEKSKSQSMPLSNQNFQEQVNVSLDIQNDNQQVLESYIKPVKSEQKNKQNEIIKSKKYSYESIPLELDDIQLFNLQKEQQNEKDDEEQSNLSFQQ